jgi:hypothetical protein
MNDGIHGIFDPERGVFVKRYENPISKVVARGMIEDRLDPDIFWFGTEADGLFKSIQSFKYNGKGYGLCPGDDGAGFC